MKLNVMRNAAAALSLGFCSIASAQYGAPAGYGYPTHPGPTDAGVPQKQAVQTFGGAPTYASSPTPGRLPTAQSTQPTAQQSPNYQLPSKWNTFNVSHSGPDLFQPVSANDTEDALALPETIPTPAPTSPQGSGIGSPHPRQGSPTPAPTYPAPSTHNHSDGSYDPNCPTCNQGGSPYVQAASQPWEAEGYCGDAACAPARPALFPWFGSFDVLFWNLDTNGKNRNLISGYSAADPTRPYLPVLGSSAIDPQSEVGYSLSLGRYFGCGQFGVGFTYFNFDPDVEQVILTAPTPYVPNGDPNPGDYRPVGMPQYRGARMEFWHDNVAGAADGAYAIYDGGAAADGVGYTGDDDYSIYHIIDGQAGNHGTNDTTPADSGGAQAIRATRDVDIQGAEVNLFSFGLMGAQRAAAMPCGPGFGGRLSSLFRRGPVYGGVGGYGGSKACGPAACAPRFGFGGAGGPLVRPCHGKVQIVTSHGFRWFQFEDSVNYAYNTDGRAGYTDHDIYDDTYLENNLFGYQFGSRLAYCLGNRLNFNLGGKFGVYGNNIEQRHRLGSRLDTATLVAMPDLAIDFESEETALATIGELDLGLGYRVCNSWTVRGGYRVTGVTGIATADGYSRDYSSTANAMAIHATDSLLLHGAYFGTDFNW